MVVAGVGGRGEWGVNVEWVQSFSLDEDLWRWKMVMIAEQDKLYTFKWLKMVNFVICFSHNKNSAFSLSFFILHAPGFSFPTSWATLQSPSQFLLYLNEKCWSHSFPPSTNILCARNKQ